MMNLRKVANVFDAVAGYVDAVEREKQAADETVRRARVDKVASAHVTAHGEEIPDDIRRKLANADPSILTYIDNVLAKQAGVVDSLGSPAVTASDDPPTTNKEAADAADQRFLNWLVS